MTGSLALKPSLLRFCEASQSSARSVHLRPADREDTGTVLQGGGSNLNGVLWHT